MTTHDEALRQAREWVRTDPQGCRDDIRRLGIEGAAEHNAELAQERVSDGDARWAHITVDAMREALQDAR